MLLRFMKGEKMRSWMVAACVCVLLTGGACAQQDEAARANDLYKAGKKLDALPLYESLTNSHPDEYLYFERLADCLAARSLQTADDTEATVYRTRMRDAAKR